MHILRNTFSESTTSQIEKLKVFTSAILLATVLQTQPTFWQDSKSADTIEQEDSTKISFPKQYEQLGNLWLHRIPAKYTGIISQSIEYIQQEYKIDANDFEYICLTFVYTIMKNTDTTKTYNDTLPNDVLQTIKKDQKYLEAFSIMIENVKAREIMQANKDEDTDWTDDENIADDK